MATKKLAPVKKETTVSMSNSTEGKYADMLILEELQKQTEFLNRMDWKLWTMMNMMKIIGEENGYVFKEQSVSDNDSEE
jgi:hypothetical protein